MQNLLIYISLIIRKINMISMLTIHYLFVVFWGAKVAFHVIFPSLELEFIFSLLICTNFSHIWDTQSGINVANNSLFPVFAVYCFQGKNS